MANQISVFSSKFLKAVISFPSRSCILEKCVWCNPKKAGSIVSLLVLYGATLKDVGSIGLLLLFFGAISVQIKVIGSMNLLVM